MADRDDVVLSIARNLLMIAVQGRRAGTCRALRPMTRRRSVGLEALHGGYRTMSLRARNGYTGEDALRSSCPWHRALRCGTPRYRRGYPLRVGRARTRFARGVSTSMARNGLVYVRPMVLGLAWTVAFEPPDRIFRGRAALEQQKAAGITDRLTGLLLEDRGIMRHGQRVLTAAGEGVITSGGFSPTMDRSIALARVPVAAEGECQVEIRSALRAARIVRPPFVRQGRVLVQ